MPKINKRLIFIIIVLVLLVATLGFLKWRKQPAVMPQPQIPKPQITPVTDEKFKIEANLQKQKIKIPDKLPVYTLKNLPLTPDESRQIAKNLGFTGNPQSYNDANLGAILIWSENNKGNLRIVLGPKIIDYKAPFSTPGNEVLFPPEIEIISKAKRFLIGRSLSTEDKLSSPQTRYLNSNDESFREVNKDQADIIDVRFTEVINKYPIVNPTTEIGTLDVQLNRNNDIISAYIDKADQILDSVDYQIKNFSQLISSLGEAKIQSLGEGGIDTFAVSSSAIEKIIVYEATISYLQELTATQQFLQPIFVLEGTAWFKDGSQTSVLLYLPALSSNS